MTAIRPFIDKIEICIFITAISDFIGSKLNGNYGFLLTITLDKYIVRNINFSLRWVRTSEISNN